MNYSPVTRVSRALKVSSVPQFARPLVRAAASVGNFALRNSVRRQKLSQFIASDMSSADVYAFSRQLFSRSEAELISQHKMPSSNGHAHGEKTSESPGDTDWINSISKFELAGYMSNTLLRDTDSTSMASSLESVPFVDAPLVDYIMQLPGEWKVDKSRPKLPKPLLADSVIDLLPESFLSRPKMGFTLPFQKWMLGLLQDEVGRTLGDKSIVESSGLNFNSAQEMWRRFNQSPSAVGWTRPWALYALAKWCELNNVRA